MRKIKVTQTTKTDVVIDVEFPIYRKHDVGEDYHCVYYTRIDENGVQFTVKHSIGRGETYEFEVEEHFFNGMFPTNVGDIDYFLGRDEYELSKAEFDEVVAKAQKFTERFL